MSKSCVFCYYKYAKETYSKQLLKSYKYFLESEVINLEKVMNITSGECVATCLINNNIKNVFPFNEAMCEGNTTINIMNQEFCKQRAKAYGITEKEYVHFDKRFDNLLNNIDRIELFFDDDMFCVINTITLLAYLEQKKFIGTINFNLLMQDGTATILKSFPIKLGNFNYTYQQVLINRKATKTGIKHLDKGIILYLEYKQQDNKIIRYIKANKQLSRRELCKQIIINFREYGVGDIAILKLIDTYKK